MISYSEIALAEEKICCDVSLVEDKTMDMYTGKIDGNKERVTVLFVCPKCGQWVSYHYVEENGVRKSIYED